MVSLAEPMRDYNSFWKLKSEFSFRAEGFKTNDTLPHGFLAMVIDCILLGSGATWP